MSELRPHVLADKDALSRRRVWENFLYFAERLNEVRASTLGDRVLHRGSFDLTTWMELNVVNATTLNFLTPDYGYIVPDALIEDVQDDGFAEGVIGWSLEIIPSGDGSHMIMAWPVVDGQALYGGEDHLQVDQIIQYPTISAHSLAMDPANTNLEVSVGKFNDDLDAFGSGITYRLALGNRCTYLGLNARSHVGIVVQSIGRFEIKKCTVTRRRVLR